jgi:radical SAM superfamily enzyme YgiQ (UPF0313 family)
VRERGDILVVSCYELGHPPLAVGSVLASLVEAGFDPLAIDLAVEPDALGDAAALSRARLVLVSVPMHTALHLGVRASAILRRQARRAHVGFYGLYAQLNAGVLLGGAADSVASGECEPILVDLARALEAGRPLDTVEGLGLPGRAPVPRLARTSLRAPLRDRLPSVERYARLEVDGTVRLAAAVETSRGCLHLCRHCPIPPVYGGRFFVVPREAVLDDVRALVGRGVRHVTFADPDFLNGPGHAMAVVRAMHGEHPGLTFDVTTKVEHVLRHRDKLPELAACGCLFLVSAVESLSATVLRNLDKGHSPEDVREALSLVRAAGIALRPTFVPFTPWTTMGDFLELLSWVEREALVTSVDPVQWSIRLLVPPGSLLASSPSMTPHVRGLDPASFSHRWVHPDPRMDALHVAVNDIVRDSARKEEPAVTTFERVRRAAYEASGMPAPTRSLPARVSAPAPRLTEPWFC